MERYACGDDAAFERLYDAVAPRLFSYLLRQTRDRGRAEDLLQQTLLHMHKARGTFLPGAEVMPWAFAIARRLLVDHVRKDRRDRMIAAAEMIVAAGLVSSAGVAADDLVHARQVERRVQEVLLALPDTQRVAFELVKQDGLSHAEAAQVLGTTVAAIKQRTHRAYTALRVAVGAPSGREDES